MSTENSCNQATIINVKVSLPVIITNATFSFQSWWTYSLPALGSYLFRLFLYFFHLLYLCVFNFKILSFLYSWWDVGDVSSKLQLVTFSPDRTSIPKELSPNLGRYALSLHRGMFCRLHVLCIHAFCFVFEDKSASSVIFVSDSCRSTSTTQYE